MPDQSGKPRNTGRCEHHREPLPASGGTSSLPGLSARTVFAVLSSRGLLREVIAGGSALPDAGWTLDPESPLLSGRSFTSLSYDSRTVGRGTLLFCKGNFKDEYLSPAIDAGLAGYVADHEIANTSGVPGFIVTDVYQAMALVSQEFYGHPERNLRIVAITGTKGKTTTAYMTHAILSAATGGKCALMCSEADCLDGKTWTPSTLTTPESPDMMRMMREAVDHGMRDLVLEVSSQAFKIGRVFGLTFDVGAFLNISPDHISPIEHPSFEDYFFAKRRMVAASRILLVNATLGDPTRLVLENAGLLNRPVATFSLDSRVPATFMGTPVDETSGSSAPSSSFSFHPRLRTDGRAGAEDLAGGVSLGTFRLDLEGDFNYQNALAAVSLSILAGVSPKDAASLQAVDHVLVPGRMQRFQDRRGAVFYVDYAHNYLSLHDLLAFVRERYPKSSCTVVTGTSGGKAFDRREGMARAAAQLADRLIVTQDDPNFESMETIAHQIADPARRLADPARNPERRQDLGVLDVRIENDRAKAIQMAYDLATTDQQHRRQVVLVIGKGDEKWLKVKGRMVPWPSDTVVVRDLCAGRPNPALAISSGE